MRINIYVLYFKNNNNWKPYSELLPYVKPLSYVPFNIRHVSIPV